MKVLAPLVLLTLAACATTGEPQVREGVGTCDLV
jgi:hypothetical protein